jgi:hypothetical protein
MTEARELAGYKLDLLGVQKVRWDKEGTTRTWDYSFVLSKRKKKLLGTRFYVNHTISSDIVLFISNRVS